MAPVLLAAMTAPSSYTHLLSAGNTCVLAVQGVLLISRGDGEEGAGRRVLGLGEGSLLGVTPPLSLPCSALTPPHGIPLLGSARYA